MTRYEDNSVYNGFFENGRRHGAGIMEYSNGGVYIGEWSRNLRDGKGRFENAGKIFSGNFKSDLFKMACAVDLDEILKDLNKAAIPHCLEAFYNANRVQIKTPQIKVDSLLYDFLNPGLLTVLRERCKQGKVRGHIFRKVRRLLADSTHLKDISRYIHLACNVVPKNNQILQIVREVIPQKLEVGQIPMKWYGINFNDKKAPEFEFKHMIITDDTIIGNGVDENGKEYTLDGICAENGGLYIFQKYDKEIKTMYCIAGPNYLAGIDSREVKFCLIPDLDMWKGFFIEESPEEKRTIRYFFRINGDILYGFGRDNLGVYFLTGTVNEASDGDPDKRRVIKITNNYSDQYSVELNGRLDAQNEIVSLD